MTDVPLTVVLGTRGSALARWQTDHVSGLLCEAWPDLTIQIQVLTTQGDRVVDTPLPLIGGKGLFTAELEAALRAHAIDFAVHSLKDLPTENPPDLILGAVPKRAAANDVLVSRKNYTLRTLPQGAVVGTSSRRRAAQLLHCRPDLHTVDIRGNIDTRIRKALDPAGKYDAIILASAGL
ncbi:MAG: hydroxymethylbilane synthase, partial [Anaerolineae bacterium]|nr:hydroxymethylbilane synthase [Anaerolineae bacterium]